MSNRLDPDQARHFVGPDLGPICLQRLWADNTSRQRINSRKTLERSVVHKIFSRTRVNNEQYSFRTGSSKCKPEWRD